MAMRACNNPRIGGDALSRAIAKLVAEHARDEYARRIQQGGGELGPPSDEDEDSKDDGEDNGSEEPEEDSEEEEE